MKWNILMMSIYLVSVTQTSCMFLSLLNQFEMKNPIILGKNIELRSRKMFYLMKNVMYLDQTISLTTTLRNGSLQNSPGIILQPEKYYRKTISLLKELKDDVDNFYNKRPQRLIQKPWIIISDQSKIFSRIDEPLYHLNKGTLWEHYKFKSISKSVVIGKISGNQFKFISNTTTNIYERRGNFENITLTAMTEAYQSYVELPRPLEKIANVSDTIPNSYEVMSIVRKCIFSTCGSSFFSAQFYT